LFSHGVLENLIQALSRTFMQTQIQGLSRTMSVFKDFPGLEIWKKIQGFSRTFKDPQEPCVYYRKVKRNRVFA